VTEQTVRESWTVAQFERYRDFAMQLLKTRSL
jgi:hypothetical protein